MNTLKNMSAGSMITAVALLVTGVFSYAMMTAAVTANTESIKDTASKKDLTHLEELTDQKFNHIDEKLDTILDAIEKLNKDKS